MKATDALQGVHAMFLDTAPIVYLLEKNTTYFERVRLIFEHIDTGQIRAVTSPVTLAECLVVPFRRQDELLRQAFISFIAHGNHTRFVTIDEQTGTFAADLRARYNLNLPDALQVASAIGAGCDTFFTNDLQLKRVVELRVLVLDELTV
jgi:predicted nucleic acid-binding protein